MRSIVFTTIFCTLFAWAVISKSDVSTVEATANAQTGAKFLLLTEVYGTTNSWYFVKYSPTTGETFYGNAGGSAGSWVKYEETAPIPTGQYEVQVAATANYFNGVRLEKVSGRGWFLSSGKWVELKSPGTAASPVASPAPK